MDLWTLASRAWITVRRLHDRERYKSCRLHMWWPGDKLKLPRWRYRLRERLLPTLRLETPYLARLQGWMRTPTLDSYFALTASLGTHTFFMITLPILFWCGYPSLGRA